MNRTKYGTCCLATVACLVVAPLSASAATMAVELGGVVNRVGGDLPTDFPIEVGDDFLLSLDIDPTTPDLDPSSHGLYAIDELTLVMGDFTYVATTGAGLEVLPAGSGNIRVNVVFNVGAFPELGPFVATPTAAGLTFSPTNDEFLRVFLPGFPFLSDALPLSELSASAGTLSSGNFNTWFKDGDRRADARFRLQTLATTIPEPNSAVLLGLCLGVAGLPEGRRGRRRCGD